MTNLQNKLLDLTCTHSQTLHATDCKDCIQLVNDITQLFIDEGWRVPQKPLDHKKAEEQLERSEHNFFGHNKRLFKFMVYYDKGVPKYEWIKKH